MKVFIESKQTKPYATWQYTNAQSGTENQAT